MLIACGILLCASSLQGGVIASNWDIGVPGTNAIALVATQGDPTFYYFASVGEIYRAPMGTPDFTRVASIPVSFGISQFYSEGQTEWLVTSSSVAMPVGQDLTFLYTARFGRGFALSTLKPFPPESATSIVLPFASLVLPETRPSAIAANTDYAYIAQRASSVGGGPGIYKVSRTNGADYTVFANSGAGQISGRARALAHNPDLSVLYVLDYGNLRIASYDTATGAFLGAFSIPADTSDTALSYNDGRLYTANGNGGGRIYDAATGAKIGDFQSSVSNPSPLIGPTWGVMDSVLVRGDTILLMDGPTGIHAFTDTAPDVPEPGTLGSVGAALALALAVRRYMPAR